MLVVWANSGMWVVPRVIVNDNPSSLLMLTGRGIFCFILKVEQEESAQYEIQRWGYVNGLSKPTGTQDLLPGSVEKWQVVEEKAREISRRFNYREIRTPMFEQTNLFVRGVGETTDVVEKEMYTFEDKGKRSMTLRPEGTAGVVRSYVENKLYGEPDVTKLYYIGPMFRCSGMSVHRLGVSVSFTNLELKHLVRSIRRWMQKLLLSGINSAVSWA